MTELPPQSYSRADVADAITNREVMEAARKAVGAALTELGVPLTRSEVGRLAIRMLGKLHEDLEQGSREGPRHA